MATDASKSPKKPIFYSLESSATHQFYNLMENRNPKTFASSDRNNKSFQEDFCLSSASCSRYLGSHLLRSKDGRTPACFNDCHNSKSENYINTFNPEENVAKFVTIESDGAESSDADLLARNGPLNGSCDFSIQHKLCNSENSLQSFSKETAPLLLHTRSQMRSPNMSPSSPHQYLSNNIVQRQVDYHRSHHSQADDTTYKKFKELKSKNGFSVTGAFEKSALVQESKMSILSDPPSPNSYSTTGSSGSFSLPIHLTSPVISSVVSLKAVNEEEYFSLATTRQMSCGSKASSRSSTNSLTGIQTRKRRAEDCNYISQYLYSLSPSYHNWLSGESPMITDYLNMHERRGTGSVIPVIAPDSKAQGRFVKRPKRESIENDDVIFVKAYPSPSRSSATRNIQALKTHQRSSKLIKRRVKDSNSIIPAPVSFASSYTASHHQQAQLAFVAPTITGIDMSVSQTKPVSKPVQHKGYFLRSSVPKVIENSMPDKATHKDSITSTKHCDVLVADGQGLRYNTCNKIKKKGVCHNKMSTSIMSHQTTVQRCQNTNNKATTAAVTNNITASSATLDQSADYNSSNPPKRFVNGKEIYHLKELLGAGGGGSVYSGIRMSDKLQVAIKIISKNKINRWGEIDGQIVPIEFELLRMTSQSENKGIIKMLDWFKRQDIYILIMERPQPVLDLFEYLNKHGAMTESLAKHVFKQLVKAVCHCHDKGVIHRDIKDENVIFNLQTREAKIIDFGCGAKVKDTPFTEFAGTLEFYPPEWFIEQSYKGQVVDCWSLGILLYTMLEGEVPFPKPEDIVQCSLQFKQSMKTVTDSCRHLIASMLQKEKHKRPTLENILQHPWLSEDTVNITDLTSSPLTKLDVNSERHGYGFCRISSNDSSDSSISSKSSNLPKYNQIAQEDVVPRCYIENTHCFSNTNLSTLSKTMAYRPEWSARVDFRSNECIVIA